MTILPMDLISVLEFIIPLYLYLVICSPTIPLRRFAALQVHFMGDERINQYPAWKKLKREAAELLVIRTV
jgi:hypothetical protein